ncbi:MAG: substrate-binding domain-containing protein [Candidatus Bipolaricaulota bacterium]|nr:substrate-binding domain-containing protein [Candidatus Bipolaricaulota bacterium]
MSKSKFTLAIVLAITFLFVNLAISGVGGFTAKAQDEDVTVGYIVREANAWWEIAAAGFRVGAEEQGVNAKVYMPQNMQGGQLQAQTLRQWVRLGTVDGIMVGPNVPSALVGPINEAMSQGIPVICGYGVDSPESDRLLYVGYDPGLLGEALAVSMRKWLDEYGHESGKISYSTGSMASSEDVASYEGFANPLEEAGYEVLEALVDHGSSETARRNALQAIDQNPDLVGMQGYYDYTVPAVGDAINEKGVKDEVVGMGDGFTGEMIPYLQDGSIKATTALGKFPGSKLGGEVIARLAKAPEDQWEDIVEEYTSNPPEGFSNPEEEEILAAFGLVTSEPVEWPNMPEKLYGWKMTIDEFKEANPGAWEVMVEQFQD